VASAMSLPIPTASSERLATSSARLSALAASTDRLRLGRLSHWPRLRSSGNYGGIYNTAVAHRVLFRSCDMPDEAMLRDKARDAIRSGRLPSRRAYRTLGGPGTRMTCSVCGELVTPDQSEMEIEFRRPVPPGLDRYFLHVRCLAAWEFERTKIAPESI
jgi:hypothetical protein